ncbi:angiomotin-like [Brachypodium distachyon]|uniref:angiomotin-like n=1 Tax=Brachypodium distachyon TaxID=15368 RepID=UPI00052FF8E6|nr:angiomotin-like [Brachypodium distachyon]|eukprot:XP_024317175.1 angiomotin-like [Brachypodium distachyon]
MAEEPKAAPAPSLAAPAAAAAATTAATRTTSLDVPVAADYAGANSSATQQEAVPARGAATPPAPQPPGAGEEEVVEEEQPHAPPQADDPPPSHTAWIDEKCELISNYLGEIQGLRVKLEVQTKATESALTAAARHEIQLNAAKDKAARLETEPAAVPEEFTKAGSSAPAPDAGATAVDLGSNAEITGMAEEPEAVPTPGPDVPAAAATATPAATGTASGDAPAATGTAGADSSAA